jgi:primosomal protein N' (replication factor Y)
LHYYDRVYAMVAVPKSTKGVLTYAVPEPLVACVRPGVRVRAPLLRRQVTGVVAALSDHTDLDPSVIRPLTEVLDSEPIIAGHLLELAHFVSSYYRCSLGTTMAAMMPSLLLRSDIEEAAITNRGVAADPQVLPSRQGALLKVLQERHRLPVASLLARAGTASRSPLDTIVAKGLARLSHRRRDHGPRQEVSAVALPNRDLQALLAECPRAPRQQQVLERLAELGRPALVSELTAAVGCSPSVVRAMAAKGLVHLFVQAAPRRSPWTLPGSFPRHCLTDEQQRAVEAVSGAIAARRYSPIVLEGVTGSGKTEVYLRALEQVSEEGRQGLVLVPEIGLTPATSSAVEHRFGGRVAVLHSAQSEGERWDQWHRVKSGEVDIVIGPRSALFAPLDRLGLIVVDEEHDEAYKQHESPRYHARDLALVLGKRLEIPVLLCSATPSAEAASLVQRELAQPLFLSKRVSGGALPQVELVDLRGEAPEPGEQGRTLFSRALREGIAATVSSGHQVILLIQRRGWAPVLLCRDCGHKASCQACSVSLVVHQRSGDLRCHYCGYRTGVPTMCAECGGTLLDAVGAGTEKVAHHLGRLFPDLRSVILDRDTVRRRNGLEESLGAFAAGRAQALIGTQMVAKGHHFPKVALTGVVSADALLSLPDFRAGERTFQLLTQVAGRAGRGETPGRVIVQTYYPDHPAVRFAVNHDTRGFLREELAFRRAFAYSPAVRMALVRFESGSQAAARIAAERAVERVMPVSAGVRVRGPAPAPLEKVRNLWRWQVLISAPNRTQLREILDRIEGGSLPQKARRIVDIDPVSTL